MNSKGFLIFRALAEFAAGIALAFAAVDVAGIHLFHSVWVDVPFRVLLAILAYAFLSDANTLRRDI
jgi:hypothetical protein